MASEMTLLGRAIETELNTLFSGEFSSEFGRDTEVALTKLGTDWDVDVIPSKHATKTADRSSRHHEYSFDVVFRRKFDMRADEATAVDPLCDIVEQVTDLLYGIEPTINGNDAECIGTDREPPFDPKALTKGLFLSVVTGVWTLNR